MNPAQLALPIIIFGGMYLLLIRPQKQKMRERDSMVRAAGVGDEVATVGGVIGVIVAEEGVDIVALEVDNDVELRVQRRAIGEIVTKAEDMAPDDPGDLVDETDGDLDSHEGPISEG